MSNYVTDTGGDKMTTVSNNDTVVNADHVDVSPL